MNRIVLIGNGFDLAHGLKTNYKDFIDDYWNRFLYHCIKQDIEDPNDRYQYDSIDLSIPDEKLILSEFLPFRFSTNRYFSRMPISYIELKEKFNQHNKLLKDNDREIVLNINNKFLTHLLEISNKNKSWVDIENEYYKFLCGTFVASTSTQYQFYYIEDLNPDFEHIKQKLDEYFSETLKKNQIQESNRIKNIIYSDFVLKDFTEKGQEDIANDEYEKVKKEITKIQGNSFDLMSEKTRPKLSFFEKIDDQYLPEIILQQLQNEFNAKQYFDLKIGETLFLNFNYTDTEKYYFNDGFNTEIIHIHGELNNPNNPIIFGYGDELEENYSKLENLRDNAYLENIKSIKYQETDNYKRMLSFINSDKYQVIILGHSCGNSDRTLLNTLFEHENCVSIKPYYYQYKNDKEEVKDNYSDIVRNISRSFKDKKSMRDKVVNKTYTTWFSSDIKEDKEESV